MDKRTGRSLHFAPDNETLAKEGEQGCSSMGAGFGARSMSSGVFPAYGGGSGTTSAGGSVQQELADAEGMTRSKSDLALQRGKSKKEIKTEQATKFYRDLTDALHNRVADFMVGVNTEDDEEDEMEELKKDLTTTINALREALMSEVKQREQGERILRDQLGRQEQDRLNDMQSIVGKVSERVQRLENFCGSNVEKLSRDVEALKSGNVATDMEKLTNANQMQAARVQELERRSSDLVDHVQHIMDSHGQLEHKLVSKFRNYTDELDSKYGHHDAKHEEHIANFNSVQHGLTRIGAEVEDQHSNLVKTLEVSLNDALGKTHAMIIDANKGGAETAKDLAALRSEVDEQHRKAVDGFAPQMDNFRMSLNSLQQELATVREQCARSMQATLDNFGNNMAGKLDKKCSDLGALVDQEAAVGEQFRKAAQDCFDRLEKRFATLDEACNGQALHARNLAENSALMDAGLNQLKSSMGKLANNTANELQANRDDIDQLCKSLCNVSKSWGSNIRSRRR